MADFIGFTRDPFPAPSRLPRSSGQSRTDIPGAPVTGLDAPVTSPPVAMPPADRGTGARDTLVLTGSQGTSADPTAAAPQPVPAPPESAPAPAPTPKLHPEMPDAPEVKGQVGKWIHEAKKILVKHGMHPRQVDARAIAIMIHHESRGNPRAVNNWDYNAQIGTPSIGIMQTIRPTFNRYKLKGHGDIYNPVHNIIAGVRYAIDRYGSLDQVPGVRATRRGRPYQGY
ncbi:MAG: transglycosylase SLT domain-containing protein [bacterium]|nr:transglycosylase SLT domain-containing protein [bacterium]